MLAAVAAAPSIAETLVFPPYGHSYGIRKATPKHLFMFFGPLTSFADPQGLATAKMQSRDDPSTEKDDDELVVYGVNSDRHEIIYNTSMWTLDRYGSRGDGVGEFKYPRGVATEPGGNVYVVDSGNNRIVHLFNPQRKVRWVKAFGGGEGGEALRDPSQIGLTARGSMYVTDTGNRRIVAFAASGEVLRTIPADGTELFEEGPTTLAVADGREAWSHFEEDRAIFCADMNGRRLWKLSFDGRVRKRVRMPEGHSAYYGAVDYYHNFWVTDRTNHCILKFDRNLELLDIVGSFGDGDFQFRQPRGIAIWKRYGQTFVAEEKGAQYYWMGTDKKSAHLRRNDKGTWVLHTNLTAFSYAALFKAENADTLYYITKRRIPSGKAESPISIRRGKALRPGARLTLRLKPTYSSYTYYHWDYPITAR